MLNNTVVGRYAPSPSGRMHLGNAFTALMSWLYARYYNGSYLLRIEDLDTDRCKEEYTVQIRDDLRWLGLRWDAEGPQQSSRSDAYLAFFEELNRKGLIYPCFCSRAALHSASAPHASDGSYVYPGTCRYLTPDEIKMQSKAPAYRIIVPDVRISFHDFIQGDYSENLKRDCGDFILRRPDGIFSYQIAVSVDDAAMGVNQIVRGRDLLPSTPRQIWLLELQNAVIPKYYHVPLLCAEDGHRLSKRNMDIDLSSIRLYRNPEDVIGYLAFLAGIIDRNTKISLTELLSVFHPERIKKEDILISSQEWDSFLKG